MNKRPSRLTELSPQAFKQLQIEADELANLQQLLNWLPMGLQVETLSDEALDRLRRIARAPMQELCGAGLLTWNNMCRSRGCLKTRN